jgi:membrane protease subunit HflK
MKRHFGWGGRGAVLNENRGGPWGGSAAARFGAARQWRLGRRSGGGPRNPWGLPGGGGGPRKRRPGMPSADVTSLDDWLKRSREKIGRGFPGGGGGGAGANRPLLALRPDRLCHSVAVFTSIHRIGPQERGVVTTFGRYERTLIPGISFTWPAPISRVEMVGVEEIREIPIPAATATRKI